MPRIHTGFHPPMKTRPFPFVRTIDVAVLHGIEMDVIKMPLEIVFVFERVLPKPALPDASAVFVPLRFRNRLLAAPLLEPAAREFFLDPTPPSRIPRVASRHCPNRVQMIVQQDDRIDLERPFLLTFSKDVAKQLPRHFIGEQWMPSAGNHREEKRPTRHIGSTIIRHRFPRSRAGSRLPPVCFVNQSYIRKHKGRREPTLPLPH